MRERFRGPLLRAAMTLGLLLACLIISPNRARAMTVLPPTFEELVYESARIVRGRVIAVETHRAATPDGGSVIKTRVTWELSSVLKGTPAKNCTLDFLGGSIGDEQLNVPGMPSFAPGDEDFLFVEPDEQSLCPLLAAGHGRYRVKQEPVSGRAFVARDNDAVLSSVDDVALPLTIDMLRRAPAAGLTPEDFEARVRAVIARSPPAHATH